MKRTKYETETSITMNDEDSEAILWTCQKPMLRRMAKLGAQIYRNDGEGKSFKIPKTWIKVRPPTVMKLTEDQRTAKRDHIKSILRSRDQSIPA